MIKRIPVIFFVSMTAALFSIWLMIAATDRWMDTTALNRCTFAFPKWFGCVLANHESLASGLFGAWGAVLAGYFAYAAAMSEAERQERKRLADQAAAKQAAVIILAYPLFAATHALKSARNDEYAIVASDPVARHNEIERVREGLKNNISALRSTISHFSLSQGWQALSSSDQSAYLAITSCLHGIVTFHDNSPYNDFQLLMTGIIEQLEHLGGYMKTFDATLGDRFDEEAGTHRPTPPTI